MLGQTGALGVVAAQHRHGEAQEHAGDGRVDAGLVDEHPRDERERQQQEARADPLLDQQREDRDRHQAEREEEQVELLGVEDRDDGDGQQVVDDGQREQERPQARGQVGADHGQDRHGEGDVGGGGDRPPREPAVGAEVPGDVDQRRRDHAAHRRGHRQGRAARVAQVAGDELTLELEADDEEEDRQQAVRGPLAQAQVQVQRDAEQRDRLGDRLEVADRLVGAGEGGVGPDDRDGRADDEQQASGGLRPQHLGDAAGLQERASAEEPRLRVGAVVAHPGGVGLAWVGRGSGRVGRAHWTPWRVTGSTTYVPTRLPGSPAFTLPREGVTPAVEVRRPAHLDQRGLSPRPRPSSASARSGPSPRSRPAW